MQVVLCALPRERVAQRFLAHPRPSQSGPPCQTHPPKIPRIVHIPRLHAIVVLPLFLSPCLVPRRSCRGQPPNYDWSWPTTTFSMPSMESTRGTVTQACSKASGLDARVRSHTAPYYTIHIQVSFRHMVIRYQSSGQDRGVEARSDSFGFVRFVVTRRFSLRTPPTAVLDASTAGSGLTRSACSARRARPRSPAGAPPRRPRTRCCRRSTASTRSPSAGASRCTRRRRRWPCRWQRR